MARTPRINTQPPLDSLTIEVEELIAAPKSDAVVVKGFIEEQENCGAMLTAPDCFAQGLRLGDKLKITKG